MHTARVRVLAAALVVGALGVLPTVLTAPAGATTPGQVVITEWMYNPTQAAPVGSEFVEITNIGGSAVDLSTYSFDDDSRTAGSLSLAALGSLAPGESALITETPAATFRADWGLGSGVKVLGSNTQNLGRNDEVNIYDGATLADRLTYGDQNIAGTIRTVGTSGVPATCGALGANTVGAWSFSQENVAGAKRATSGDIGSPGTSPLNTCGPVTIVGGNGSGSTVPCQPEAASGTGSASPGAQTWPGGASVAVADELCSWKTATGPEGRDMSGLDFDPTDPGVLWAVKNKSWLFRLVKQGGRWVSDVAGGWGGGKQILFPGGTGQPDSEGVTVGPDGALFVTTERDNARNTFALNSILRFDPTASGTALTPTQQWDLTADFPELVVPGGNKDKANLGFEGVTFVPDASLVAGGFVDQSTGDAYDPADYPDHGSGLFFAALENDGKLYAYALDTDGTSHRVAVVDTGMGHVMDVQYDADLDRVWAMCDNTCGVTTTLLTIDPAGTMVPNARFARPADPTAGLPNVNIEGFAIAPESTCASGVKEVVWSDDGLSASGNLGHALYSGTLPCGFDPASAPETTIDAAPSGVTSSPQATVAFSGSDNLTSPSELDFECAVDGAAFAPCTSPLNLVELAPGSHTVTVRATDEAGNTDGSPATASWGVAGLVAPGVSVGDVTVPEGDDGPATVEVPVTLSWPSAAPVSVTYATTASTATSPDDFEAAGPEVVTFAPGETSTSVELTVDGDHRYEKVEKFTLGLSSPVGASLADPSAVVTLLNDDAPLSVTVSDPAVLEGDAGPTMLNFELALSGPVPAGASASVDVVTSGGSATDGTDYVGVAPVTVTFGPGDTSKPVAVLVQSDGLVEKNETVSLKLSAPVGLAIADASGTGTIVDDDGGTSPAWPAPTVAIHDTTVIEGDAGTDTALVSVTLSAPSTAPVAVSYTASGLTARPPADFAPLDPGAVTFAPGETAKTIAVEVVGDEVAETTETASISLRSPIGAKLADPTATLSILDTDPGLRVSVGNGAVVERDGDTATLAFVVSLSGPVPVGGAVTMDIDTLDGSAKAGSDYVGLAAMPLAFGAGDQTKVVLVEVVGDTAKEKPETLSLRARNAIGATFADSIGLGTIVDDD